MKCKYISTPKETENQTVIPKTIPKWVTIQVIPACEAEATTAWQRPAKAGIQLASSGSARTLDSRFRGNDSKGRDDLNLKKA